MKKISDIADFYENPFAWKTIPKGRHDPNKELYSNESNSDSITFAVTPVKTKIVVYIKTFFEK